jgi:hypothetical protein
MHLTTQLSVFLENRPGTLAEICRVLGRAKINIVAMTTSDSIDHAVDRLVVSNPKKAVRIFEERGVLVIESEVLQIEGPNHPGALAEIAQRLADAKINIDYLYFATPPASREGLIILRCPEIRRAMRILNRKKKRT